MTEDQKIDNLNFEQALKELETIVGKLESGQGGLEDSITLYERGVALRQYCEGKLKAAESRIEKISLDANGQVKTEAMDNV